MELIYKDKLLEAIDACDYCNHCRFLGSACFCDEGSTEEAIVNLIKDTPAVDAVPVVRGHWKQISADEMYGSGSFEPAAYVCSCCGFDIELCDEYNFCPNCGADMRGENNGTD